MTASKTQGSTHGERKFAAGAEVALLDQLDALVKGRDHQAGVVGNLTHALDVAKREYEQGQRELRLLEEAAARTRAAYELLHSGRPADDEALA